MGAGRAVGARRTAASIERYGDEAPAVLAAPGAVGAGAWGDEALRGVTQAVAALLTAPMAAITLDGEHGQPFRSGIGFPASWIAGPWTPLALLNRQVLVSGRPFVIGDARRPSSADDAGAAGSEIVAYLGVPLIASDGRALGTLCALDRRPRSWRRAQIGLVASLATTTARLVELRGFPRAPARPDDDVPLPSEVGTDLKGALGLVRGRLRLLRERLERGGAPESAGIAASLREIETGADWVDAQVCKLFPSGLDREAATGRPIRIDRTRRGARPSGGLSL